MLAPLVMGEPYDQPSEFVWTDLLVVAACAIFGTVILAIVGAIWGGDLLQRLKRPVRLTASA